MASLSAITRPATRRAELTPEAFRAEVDAIRTQRIAEQQAARAAARESERLALPLPLPLPLPTGQAGTGQAGAESERL